MPLEQDEELGSIQRRVVDSLHLMVSVFGGVVLVIGILRSLVSIGSFRPVLPTICFFAVMVVTYVFKSKLSWLLRSWVLLTSLVLAGFGAMWNFGITSPGGMLIPLMPIFGWLILPRLHSIVLTSFSTLLFVVVAAKNILFGSLFDAKLGEFNRTPVFWINTGVVYFFLSGILLVVVLDLLGAWRKAMDKARERERESLADKERLAGILQGIHDAVFIHDPTDGRILELHGRVEEMYRIDPARILEEGVGVVSAGESPWTLDEARQWIQRALIQGPQTFPWRARRGDGTFFWVEVTIRIVVLEGADRILVTVRDIDESMKIHQELTQLNATLEQRVLDRTAEIERSRAASESFSYTVSHDLRAPLRAIDGFAKALQEDFAESLPASAAAYLDRIIARANRMGKLIDALLGLSRLERHPIQLEPVDLDAVVREVREEICGPESATDLEDGRILPVWNVESLPAIESDLELAKQVFANLLGNAVKFSSRSTSPRIAVRALQRPDGPWVEVSDNGVGFDDAFAKDLFQVFHRLHGEAFDGVGIGLATVKMILDRLGGAIEAESAMGKGATFRFRLGPAATDSVPA